MARQGKQVEGDKTTAGDKTTEGEANSEDRVDDEAQSPESYQILWTSNALSMLNEIIDYIAEDSISNARTALNRIRSRVDKLNQSPFGGRYLPELLDFGLRTYREVIVKPWRIIYRVSTHTVYVLLIIDSRRNVGEYLIRNLF